MKVVAKTSESTIATVYLAETNRGKYVEFVESVQPPFPIEKKWVLIISTLCGCPVSCKFCDSGSFYEGLLSLDELFAQIDFPIMQRFGSRHIPIEKFKVQFARMGDPSLNPAVIDCLDQFPSRYDAPGFIPSVSTVAPRTAITDDFFERLIEVKDRHYRGRFQLQFSVHDTDEKSRSELIPIRKWDFRNIADYAERFRSAGDKKVTLNFALADEKQIDINVLKEFFSPDTFAIKITPINPTTATIENSITSLVITSETYKRIKDTLGTAGYDVIMSIGEYEENKIGSNCGQVIRTFLNTGKHFASAYTYSIEEFE